MRSRDIPRPEWREFFDSFSRQHQGWIASTEVGGKAAVRDLPLSGIASDSEGIEVILGPAGERHVHSIEEPTRVSLLENDDGGHAGVCIETADGDEYYVKFRVAARPEALDGLGGTVL